MIMHFLPATIPACQCKLQHGHTYPSDEACAGQSVRVDLVSCER